jgi:hypothetical protein
MTTPGERVSPDGAPALEQKMDFSRRAQSENGGGSESCARGPARGKIDAGHWALKREIRERACAPARDRIDARLVGPRSPREKSNRAGNEENEKEQTDSPKIQAEEEISAAPKQITECRTQRKSAPRPGR